MNQHVPADLLNAFVEGETTEQLAIRIAEHLDVCPACATRAATLEPLASAFARVPDPEVPADLVGAVLAEVHAPPAVRARWELAVGAGFLVAASALLLAGDPVGVAVDLGIVTEVATSILTKVSSGVTSSAVTLVGTSLMALASVAATARLTLPDWRLS